VRRGDRVDVGEQVDLEPQLLRRALLDEVGVRHGRRQVRRHDQPVAARTVGQAELDQRRPRAVHHVPQTPFGVGRGVPRDDV
jgi:hypothetical protein